MMKATSFSLVIPCYNEELAIPSFLIDLQKFVELFINHFPTYQLQIIFVNNNSTDQSWQMLSALKINKPNLKFSVLNCEAQGYGAALKYGFSVAESDYVAFADIDLTYPLNSFIPGLENMISNQADMLMTDRMSADISEQGMPKIRFLGNFIYKKLVQILFNSNINDVCSGMRIIAANKIHEVLVLKDNGLAFSIELTCWSLKNKWNVQYMPIHYRERIGFSKLSVFSDGIYFLLQIFKVRFSRRVIHK